MERLDMNCWRRALNFGILLCCLMITVACSKEDDEESDPLLEALPSELTLTDNEDGSASGFITLNTNRRWKIYGNADWLKVTPMNGEPAEGEQIITLSAPINKSRDIRKTVLTIEDADFQWRRRFLEVSQNPGGLYIEKKNGVFTVNGVTFKLIKVPKGTFTMGSKSTDDTVEENERPTRMVTISDFCIGETEVTQQLWQAVMGSNPSKIVGENLPVVNVSWNDCQDFISKLNEMTGLWFRLPTEAEWEYAARGGQKSQGFVYAGSNTLSEVGWFTFNSNNSLHEVKQLQPNELGIYDMSGNVWEWCQDWFSASYYQTSEEFNDPVGPSKGFMRVIRGGRYNWLGYDCRVARREGENPQRNDVVIGLRLAIPL